MQLNCHLCMLQVLISQSHGPLRCQQVICCARDRWLLSCVTSAQRSPSIALDLCSLCLQCQQAEIIALPALQVHTLAWPATAPPRWTKLRPTCGWEQSPDCLLGHDSQPSACNSQSLQRTPSCYLLLHPAAAPSASYTGCSRAAVLANSCCSSVSLHSLAAGCICD